MPASPSSIEDPTNHSSCFIFVSNALYSFFNCIEKTPFPESSVPFPWPSKRAEEAEEPSVVEESANAEEDIDAV
jgi:hypothetical protein